jgi:hypothetical protein
VLMNARVVFFNPAGRIPQNHFISAT